MLDMTAIDNNITEAGRVLGDQAGISLDGVVREILNAGTNVQYGDGSKTSRSAITDTDVMTVAAVKRAVTTLKRMNAKKINGDYVAIIHPDVAYDLMNDTKWEAVATYNPKNLYALVKSVGCTVFDLLKHPKQKSLKKQEQVLLMYILLCSSAQMLTVLLLSMAAAWK